MSYVDRIEQQLQALKGLIMTFGCQAFVHAYSIKCTADPNMARLGSTGTIIAQQRVAQVTTWINNFSNCLSSSVLAFCITRAFDSIAGSKDNSALQEALRPLHTIVDRKVWSPSERKELFELCFMMLYAFWSEAERGKRVYTYQGLIDEIRSHFPEETAEIKAPE